MRRAVAWRIDAWFVVLSVLTLAACSRHETGVEAGHRLGILQVGNRYEPRDLDPHIITAYADMNIVTALMEGLTSTDPRDGTPVPGVAEKWECSADGLTWTFHLRANARWSNGDPVTAADFLYGFRRVLSPALAAEYASFLFCLKEGEAFNTGKVADFGAVGCAAPNDHTVVLTLKTPTPYLPALVSMPAWYPVHRATIEKYGAIDARSTAWTRAGNYVGNGAFDLKEWRQNQVIRVKRSATYWDRENVRLEEVAFSPMETLAEEAAFRSGQLHVTSPFLPTSRVVAWRSDPKRAPMLHESPMLSTDFLWVNCTKAPLDDERVRRALSLAIDRVALTRTVLQSNLAASSLTAPGAGDYRPNTDLKTDVAEARRLLAAAGYPGGKGLPALVCTFSIGTDSNRATVEVLQEMWRQALGITISLQQVEGKILQDMEQHRTYQLLFDGWIGDYPDPTTFLDLLETRNGNNHAGWSSPDYDRLLKDAATAPAAGRFPLLQKAETLLLEATPVIPLFYRPQRELRQPMVLGWYDNPLGRHPLKHVSLAPGR